MNRCRRTTFALALAIVALTPVRADAIRPFVTDDARVVGKKLAQVETWVLVDRLAAAHNALFAIGPTDWLELTAGFTHGGVHTQGQRAHSLTGPILQGKALLIAPEDNGRPGFALAGGLLPPWGYGTFKPDGLVGFGFFAMTESLFDQRVLIHANIGMTAGDEGAPTSSAGFGGSSGGRIRTLVTMGVGFQGTILAGLHGIAEIYRGDPYDPHTNFPAMQGGFRYIFNDDVQMDGTIGSTLVDVSGDDGAVGNEQWGTVGLRLVTPELW